MKLTIRKSDSDPESDWYLIEKAEHDGRTWLERTSYGSRFMASARISDADVEGGRAEMLAIAEGIETRKGAHFKRCSVEIVGDEARFSSPRNSTVDGVVSLAEADDLAKQIKALLAPKGVAS